MELLEDNEQLAVQSAAIYHNEPACLQYTTLPLCSWNNNASAGVAVFFKGNPKTNLTCLIQADLFFSAA